MKNQRGSATVLAIVTMIFIGIIIAGLLPMITNELKIGIMNKDVIEAQYAAEAGTKRAIVGFSQSPLNLSWIDKGDDGNGNIAFIDDVNTKKYKVIIFLQSDTNKTPLLSSALTFGKTYTIRSTGTVGKTTKNVYVDVGTIISNGTANSPFQYVGYAGGAVSFEQAPAVNGAPFGVVGAFSNAQGRNVINVAQGNIQIPAYNVLTALRDPTRPVLIINGNYEIPMNTNTQNTTLIVNGDLTGSNVNFNNANIFVTGSINLSNFNMNGSNFIVSQKSLTTSNNSNFGNSVVVTYGSLAATNTTLNGAIIAAGSMAFSGGANFNYNESVVKQFISGLTSTSQTTVTNWKSL